MKIFNRFFVALLLFAMAFSAVAQMPAINGFSQGQRIKRKTIEVDHSLPVAPLISKDEGFDLGTIYDFQMRGFQITVENPTDKDIAYTSVVINCSCTSTNIAPKGVIPAHGKLTLPMWIDGSKSRDKDVFKRHVALVLEGYQPFYVNFTGRKAHNLRLCSKSTEGEMKYFSWLPVGFAGGIYSDWQCSVDILLTAESEDEVLELEEPLPNDKFTFQVTPLEKNYFRVTAKPKLPQNVGAIKGACIIPIKGDDPNDYLAIPLMGVVGWDLVASVDYLPIEKKEDGTADPVTFALVRDSFKDKFAMMAIMKGYPNPYDENIKELQVEEVRVPETDGVKYTLAQDRNMVLVTCDVDPSKIPAGGMDVEFTAPNSSYCLVTIIDSKEYEKMKAEEEAEMNEGMLPLPVK